jgi:ABC-type polysaccharide/polyol phosphate transport system ATPase subunit
MQSKQLNLDERKLSKKYKCKKETDNVIVLRKCSFIRSSQESANNSPQSLCLENLDCSIRKGELVGVIGHMGSGKSTFIEAVAGEQLKVRRQ